jgi:hypothetical protein
MQDAANELVLRNRILVEAAIWPACVLQARSRKSNPDNEPHQTTPTRSLPMSMIAK